MIETDTTCTGRKISIYRCDECDRVCRPHSGFWRERMYRYDGQDLCIKCLLDDLENAFEIKQITE